MPKISITRKLESHRLLIFNSSDPQIATLLDAMGIDSAYLKQGEALYNETTQLVDQQKKEYQEQSLSYDKFYVEKDNASDTFKRTFKLIKVLARKDQDLQNRLNLNVGKPSAIEEWIASAIDFYNLLNNETAFLATIAKFKVTKDRLASEKQSIVDLKQLRNEAMSEKGEAQEATRQRNEKLEALDDYCAELKAIARMALEAQPQLLEKLGILVRS